MTIKEIMLGNNSVRLLLLISFVLCVITAFLIYTGYKEKQEAQALVSHTNEVIQNAILVQATFKEVETNQRGFLITEDSSFYKGYALSVQNLKKELGNVYQLTIDNSMQSELINSKLNPLLNGRVAEMDETIRLFSKREKYTHRIQNALHQDDLIHQHITILINREKDLLKARQEKLENITFFTKSIMYCSVLLIGITSVLAYSTINRAQKENLSLLNSLELSNQNLEQKVDEQTGRIKEANNELYKKNNDLNALNEELRSSEEAVRANLDYIISLKADLEKSEELHRMLSENSMDIIAVFSLDNTFEYVSPAAKTILGYEPEELVGKKGDILIHPEDIALLTAPANIAMGPKEMTSQHFRLRKKDGSYVWIEAHSNPITDESGEVIKIQTLNRDITDRKMAELAMLEAKEKAEEATRTKSQFLSAMSHEIRTPMNAVIGLTTILLENSPREDQEEHLKLLKFSGDNLLTIINDILDFSKIEAGKLTLEIITFNLNELLINLHRLHEPKAKEKGINLILNYDESVPKIIQGDPVRISQILTNLVSNAIKFTAKGYVEISVKSEPTTDQFHELGFFIKDTGIGVAQDQLTRIFESFSQANADTTRKFGGTGLGLSITKNLIALMNGNINVVSTPGYGSTFQFTVVLEEGQLGSPLQMPVEDFSNAPMEALVLLVEDNKVNQVVARNFLYRWGLRMEVANNGIEALRVIKNQTYDLVLMDLQMPEMDGFTAARKIREMEGAYYKNIPIIALTAEAMVEIKDKALAFGMNDYISKPFDPLELRAKIIKYLMSFSLGNHQSQQPLLNGFHLFTQGDIDFKRELAQLIIENLKELQLVIKAFNDNADIPLFSQALHKTKTGLKILSNPELDRVIEKIKAELKTDNYVGLSEYKQTFVRISDKLIDSLNQERTNVS